MSRSPRLQQLTADKRRLRADRRSAAAARETRQLEYSAAAEQLRRQIQQVRSRMSLQLIAPQDAVVSRVHVVEGESIQPGQTLLTLLSGAADLLAWLYIASRNAGKTRFWTIWKCCE